MVLNCHSQLSYKYNVGVDLNYVTIKINETKNMCENVELSLGQQTQMVIECLTSGR